MPGYELIGEEERKLVSSIFEDNGGVLFAHGFDGLRKRYFVKEFEDSLSNFFNEKSAVTTSSGTASIFCALKSKNLTHGDEVITQGFNFAATAEAIYACNAKVVIADVDENLFMSPRSLKEKITSKTKAVILVHMLGQGGNVYEIKEICEQNNVCLIEDNCESFGAKVDDILLGCLGDIGAFSFDHGKTLTTGEGGFVLAKNSDISDFVRSFRDHGHENKPSIPRGIDNALMPGFNFRMTEMQAAVGIEQLKKVKKLISLSFERFSILENTLKNKFTLRRSSGIGKYKANYDTFMILDLTQKEIDEIIGVLNRNNFSTKNIPDAMKWHCSYFWEHLLESEQINNSLSTLHLLQKSIAIPILVSKPLEAYANLANELFSL